VPPPFAGYEHGEESRYVKLVESDGWSPANSERNDQGLLEAVHDATGLRFVLIPAGEFSMGSPPDEPDRCDDEMAHRVVVGAFLMSRTECTQRAWHGLGAGDVREGGDLPAAPVSWEAAEEWCRQRGLRLPSEAEWEYACRAGTSTPFFTGTTLSTDQAHFGRSRGGRVLTVSAGSRPANPWGLHEVHGNVWEWCRDVYEESYDRVPYDGSAYEPGFRPLTPSVRNASSGHRVIRGGGWRLSAGWCRSASRFSHAPDRGSHHIGFRPAADLPGSQE
jgi:formylglycine-generating enzyme required for sulfatase activity